MSVSCDKVTWRTSSRRDGWYHGSLRWASLNSGTGNLYIHICMYGIEIIQSNEYLRESETEEVVIFR